MSLTTRVSAAAACALAVGILSAPVAFAQSDPNSVYNQLVDPSGQVVQQVQPAQAQPIQQAPEVVQPGSSTPGGSIQVPHLDTQQRDGKPIIERDKSHDRGDFLKGRTIDQGSLQEGYAAAQPWVRITSKIAGWLIALTVVSLAFFNALGLFYVAVPIGFIRNFLSGGASAAGGGAMSGGVMSRGGGVMSRGGGVMSRGGGVMSRGGGVPGGGSAGGGRWWQNTQFVPTAAIRAVQLSEMGGQMQPGVGPMGGGGDAAPVRAVPYFLREQAKDMFFIGIAIVLLVLSSVLFDTGIDAGNTVAALVQWIASKVMG